MQGISDSSSDTLQALRLVAHKRLQPLGVLAAGLLFSHSRPIKWTCVNLLQLLENPGSTFELANQNPAGRINSWVHPTCAQLSPWLPSGLSHMDRPTSFCTCGWRKTWVMPGGSLKDLKELLLPSPGKLASSHRTKNLPQIPEGRGKITGQLGCQVKYLTIFSDTTVILNNEKWWSVGKGVNHR
jgi:hypothetical protein